jgi:AcrR family transcriptional regulator
MSVTRTYKSPLREQQMDDTRDRILDHVAELLAAGEEVTIAAVAERATIAVRTVYRYFPTKEALLDEFNAWLGARQRHPRLPVTVEEFGPMVADLFRSFDDNEQLTRAARRSATFEEMRKRRKALQVKAGKKAVAATAPHLDEAARDRIGALVHTIVGSDAWLGMRDHWGLSTDEAIAAVRWGIDAIVEKLERDKSHKGRK